jgi:hypothetical protein
VSKDEEDVAEEIKRGPCNFMKLRKRSAERTTQFPEDVGVDRFGRLSIRAIDKKVNRQWKLMLMLMVKSSGSPGIFWVLALGYKCFLSSSGMMICLPKWCRWWTGAFGDWNLMSPFSL